MTISFDPQIRQRVANCPRKCSFYEGDEPFTLPSIFVSELNYQTGKISFLSTASYLEGSVFALVVVCESLESTMPMSQRIAFDRLRVKFELDCSNNKIEFVSDFDTIEYYVT